MDKIITANRRVLALDFDGVIWDTECEGYVVGQKVWREIFGRWAFCPMHIFTSGRWLARTGEEFALILLIGERLCLEAAEAEYVTKTSGLKPISAEAMAASFEYGALPAILAGKAEQWSQGAEPWTKEAASFPVEVSHINLQNYIWSDFINEGNSLKHFLTFFGKRLAYWRAESRRQNMASWLEPQHIYKGNLETIQKALAIFDGVSICTTKDKASVEALLSTVGLKMLILSKEYTFDKKLQLYILAASFGVEPEQILFVDDLLDNLLKVRPQGVNVALAGWGYNCAQSRAEAKKLDIPVLNHLSEALDFAYRI